MADVHITRYLTDHAQGNLRLDSIGFLLGLVTLIVSHGHLKVWNPLVVWLPYSPQPCVVLRGIFCLDSLVVLLYP